MICAVIAWPRVSEPMWLVYPYIPPATPRGMYSESDAFIVLPGGFGTMEEMLEVLTWCQLKVINKPIYLFNPNGFWDDMLAMFQKAANHGFIRANHMALVHHLDTVDDVADVLDQFLHEWKATGKDDQINKL